jgi:hypothetical protein
VRKDGRGLKVSSGDMASHGGDRKDATVGRKRNERVVSGCAGSLPASQMPRNSSCEASEP